MHTRRSTPVIASGLILSALALASGCSSGAKDATNADGGSAPDGIAPRADGIAPRADGSSRDGTSSHANDGAAARDAGVDAPVSCPGCPVLPLEVLGAANTTVDATVQLASPAQATVLWMQLHEIDSEAKASVALNGGPFVPITNTTVTVLGSGAGFGGIGGGYHTLAMTMPVPAGALVAGANTLHFRFNGTDGVSLGYRVLAFNFLDTTGKQLLPPSSFVADDPSTWQPPLPGASDIAAGETLWRTAPLVDSPLSAAPLQAHCTDCHAQDGRDLKYFNYSNLSIRGRAQFHGLTATQGDQIASYIRSLTSPSPGRVWNPPYQPGPALTSAPPENWSAGAGLGAVVEPESTAGAGLPGSGVTDPTKLFDGKRILPVDYQDTAIPLQLLDWNRWLPNVHPKDAMSALGADFTTTKDFILYQALRAKLLGQTDAGAAYVSTLAGAGAAMAGDLVLEQDLQSWANAMTYDLYGRLFPPNPGVVGSWTAPMFNAAYSAGKWNAVKQWELMQEFHLENLQPGLYGANGNARGWFSDRHIFDASPAIIGRLSTDSLLNSVAAEGQSPMPQVVNQYLSNCWYQLQQILNTGSRHRNLGGHQTIDWGYMSGHFGDLDRDAHEGQPMRLALFALSSMAEHDSSYGPEDVWWGWNLRDDVPTNLQLVFPEWATEPNAATIVQTVYQVWLEKSATFEPAQWKAIQNVEQPNDASWPADHLGSMGYDGQDVGTDQWVIGDHSQGSESVARSVADFFFADLARMKTLGVHPAVIAASASFGKFMWPAPQNGWDAFRAPTATETAVPTVHADVAPETVTLTWSAVPGATSYNVKRGRSGDAAPLAVALLLGGTSFSDIRRAPGQAYAYTVSANFADGEGADSAAVTATPTTGLVAEWTFNEATGNVVDKTGLQSDGLLFGGATRTAHGSGTALTLDGTGYVSFPESLHKWIGGTATVSMWINTTQVGTRNHWESPTVLGSAYSASAGHDMTEYGLLDPMGHIGALFTDQTPSSVYSTQPVNDGAWHHVAITRDAASGTIEVFVDGTLSASGAGGMGVLTQRVYSLGKLDSAGADGHFKGSLDDVRIYDTVLTAAAIGALHTAGAE